MAQISRHTNDRDGMCRSTVPKERKIRRWQTSENSTVCDVGMYVMREVADDLPGHLSRRPRSVTDSKNSPSAI